MGSCPQAVLPTSSLLPMALGLPETGLPCPGPAAAHLRLSLRGTVPTSLTRQHTLRVDQRWHSGEASAAATEQRQDVILGLPWAMSPRCSCLGTKPATAALSTVPIRTPAPASSTAYPSYHPGRDLQSVRSGPARSSSPISLLWPSPCISLLLEPHSFFLSDSSASQSLSPPGLCTCKSHGLKFLPYHAVLFIPPVSAQAPFLPDLRVKPPLTYPNSTTHFFLIFFFLY